MTGSACTDNFLKDEPQITFVSSDTIYIDKANVNHNIPLHLNTASNEAYTLLQYPNFIQPATFNGKFNNGSSNFNFTSGENVEYLRNYGGVKGLVVLLLDNKEAVAFPLKIPALHEIPGEPNPNNLSVQPSSIDFGMESSFSAILFNSGNTQLSWSFEPLPAWLSVNQQQGQLAPYETSSLIFSANRDGLGKGIYHATLTILLNGNATFPKTLNASMEVSDQKLANETSSIDGFVVAATYLKNTDQLLLLTQAPNQLSIVEMNKGSKKIIVLSKKPTGMAVSNDENLALIRYTVAEVSQIDLVKQELIKNIELPFIPFGMAFGDNGWCYLSALNNESYRNTLSLNLNTEIIHRNAFNYSIMELTLIHKVPSHQHLLFIPTNSSPSHFKMGSIENDTISGYYTENYSFSSGGNMWFIKQGSQIISSGKEIFKLYPAEIDQSFISRYGIIDGPFSSIHWADECPQSKQAILTVSQGYLSPAGDSYASIYDLESYSEVNTLKPGIINNKVVYVYYSFLDSSGKTAFLIVRDDLNPYTTDGQWYLLKFKLN